MQDINLPKKLLSVVSKTIENKTYGSIEVYFENGKITQITQRIINKVHEDKRLTEISPIRPM